MLLTSVINNYLWINQFNPTNWDAYLFFLFSIGYKCNHYVVELHELLSCFTAHGQVCRF